jgi:hypothetical protein
MGVFLRLFVYILGLQGEFFSAYATRFTQLNRNAIYSIQEQLNGDGFQFAKLNKRSD